MIILLHVGLVTFMIHFGKTRKPIIGMVSDLADVSTGPKTNIIYLRRHQDTTNNL